MFEEKAQSSVVGEVTRHRVPPGLGFMGSVDERYAMVLDVDIPDPPDLTNRSLPIELEHNEVLDGTADVRREELEEILRDGAWSEAVHEWAEYTDLTEAEYRVIRDADLFEQLDFYWDPIENRLRFETPSLPAALETQPELAATITSELSDLCQTVLEMLEDAYVDWDEEGTGEKAWREGPLSGESTIDEQ